MILKFFTILVFLGFANIAYAQTIPEKKFTKFNSPIFALNGFSDFSAASKNQAVGFNDDENFGNDSQFFFKTGFMTESRAKYGALVKAEFNYKSDGQNENPNLDQAYLFSENSFGKFELGNYQAVNQKMKIGPAKFARGAGGINGKYLENVNLPASTSSSANIKKPQFILLAQSPVGHGGYAKNSYDRNFRALKDDSFDGVEDATKLSYYTPRIEGLQFGVSYAPDSRSNGITSVKYFKMEDITISNILSFGANYSQDFDNLGVEISATAEKGRVKNISSTSGVQRSNLAAYDFAMTLSYFGFNLGASYGSWGNSLQAKNGIYSCDYNSAATIASQNCAGSSNKFNNPHYYTAGISYVFGPMGASITGIKSRFQNNNYDAASLDLDYKLSKDLMPYFEVTKFAFKSNRPNASDLTNQNIIKDSQGYVLLTGILISF